MEATFRRTKLTAWYFFATLVMGVLVGSCSVGEGGSGVLSVNTLMAMVCFAAMLRAWFVRIVAEPTEVRLINWVGTQRLTWQEIRSIDPPDDYGRLFNGIRFTTRDGKVHVATAFSPGPFDPESVTAGVVAELRKFHARFGGTPRA